MTEVEKALGVLNMFISGGMEYPEALWKAGKYLSYPQYKELQALHDAQQGGSEA